MVQNTFSFSTFTAVYLLVFPLFASGPEGKIELEEKKTSTRGRSYTSPTSLSSSPSSGNSKGFFSFFSKDKNSKDKKNASKKRRSEEHKPKNALSSSPSRSSGTELPQVCSLQSSVLNALKECQVEIAQTQQRDFPPQKLSSEEIQSIMKAKFPFMLAKYSNESEEADHTENRTAFIELNNKTSASIKTTPERFKGLLVAMRTDYIDTLLENQLLANRIAYEFLLKVDKIKDNAGQMKEYEDFTVDKRITAVRAELITANSNTATAQIEKGNNARGTVYSYQFMIGSQKLSIPYIYDKEIKPLEGKVHFSFTERLPE